MKFGLLISILVGLSSCLPKDEREYYETTGHILKNTMLDIKELNAISSEVIINSVEEAVENPSPYFSENSLSILVSEGINFNAPEAYFLDSYIHNNYPYDI